jgi:DNA-binding CsgD family transcriptional regulator
MENNNMHFSIDNELEVESKTFGALISFMRNSNDYWYIKDHESRIIFINDYGIHYNGLPKGFNPEGKLDHECPVYWSENADVIQASDKNVMASQKTMPALMTCIYGGRQKMVQPFMAEVTPLIENGKSIGVVGRAKKLEMYSMYASYHLTDGQEQTPICQASLTDLFTDREFDVVFYAMHALSTQDIARCLAISPDAVTQYLQSVYAKTGANTLTQLIEYCYCHGYDKYAPFRFSSTEFYIPLVA